MKYDFVKIADLVNEEKDAIVDLICVVKSFGEVLSAPPPRADTDLQPAGAVAAQHFWTLLYLLHCR